MDWWPIHFFPDNRRSVISLTTSSSDSFSADWTYLFFSHLLPCSHIFIFLEHKTLGAGPVSAAHNYRVSQGGPSIQLRAFKGQCDYYSVEISCVPRSCKPICLHRSIEISALFSVHTQLAAHILSSYWYPEWILEPSGDRDKGEKAKPIILEKLPQAWGGAP